MQQSTTPLPTSHFSGVAEDCCILYSTSQCLLVSPVFGMVSSLHPTSFLMIFILVLYIVSFLPLTYTVTEGEDTTAELVLIRSGNLSRPTAVEVTTASRSADGNTLCLITAKGSAYKQEI